MAFQAATNNPAPTAYVANPSAKMYSSIGNPLPTYTGGFADGYASGYPIGYTAGFSAGSASVTTDTHFPVLTIVSPTPGAVPGTAGAFPADLFSARSTPIVLQATDITSGITPAGLADVIVYAKFLNYPTLGGQILEVIYHRGNFVGNYCKGSWQKTITNGVELHCMRDAGWPVGSNTLGDIVFSCDALDKAGNLT